MSQVSSLAGSDPAAEEPTPREEEMDGGTRQGGKLWESLPGYPAPASLDLGPCSGYGTWAAAGSSSVGTEGAESQGLLEVAGVS